MDSSRRVLGADRNLADILPVIDASSMSNQRPARNSIYRTGDDISVLLDEVLNNDISAVFIYDDFECFSDVDLYSLSVVMRKNTSVLAVTMSGVDIGDEMFGTFCESLLHSNVQYIDLCNTPLDEDAGRSLAALAHNNTTLRTVIVEDTLISDEALDEIDLACLFNDSTAVEMSQKRQTSQQQSMLSVTTAAAIDSSLPPAEETQRQQRLCVANEFNSCPHGASCLFAHGATNTSSAGSGEGVGLLSPQEAAQRRKNWERLLQGESDEEDAASRSPGVAAASKTKSNESEDFDGVGESRRPALKFTLNTTALTGITSTQQPQPSDTATATKKTSYHSASSLAPNMLLVGGVTAAIFGAVFATILMRVSRDR